MSFSHKHLNRRRNLQSKSRIYSTTWSALLGEEVIKNGIKWIASKNSCLSLWFDKWMSEGPLRSPIVGPRNRREKALLLKDFIQHNHWNWGSISFVIPPNLLLKIKATPTPLFADGKDRISWASFPSGEFELKEAYKISLFAGEDTLQAGTFMGSWVWKAATIPKIKCFLAMCSSKQWRSHIGTQGGPLNIFFKSQ